MISSRYDILMAKEQESRAKQFEILPLKNTSGPWTNGNIYAESRQI